MDCNFLFVWWGVGLSFSGERLVAGLAAPPHAEKGREVMESGPSLLVMAIWKERNRVVFDDEAFSKSRLKSCFLFSFSSWASLMFDVEHPFVRNIFNIP